MEELVRCPARAGETRWRSRTPGPHRDVIVRAADAAGPPYGVRWGTFEPGASPAWSGTALSPDSDDRRRDSRLTARCRLSRTSRLPLDPAVSYALFEP